MNDELILEEEVALRKESVDRNSDIPPNLDADGAVALRKESVDRNASSRACITTTTTSLSARRAWIEMCVVS